MQSKAYKTQVEAKNEKTQAELDILEDKWLNDRDNMTTDQKELRFKL
jgi:hypothetical protein